MLDGLHDQKYRIERLESCMLGNGHVQFGGGPMEQGSSLYLASGLPNSVLGELRSGVRAGGAEHRLFEALLTHARTRGWLKARGRQRTDSTHVLAAIQSLSRLECVAETLRHALNVLATVEPMWLQAWVPNEWFERYATRWDDDRLPSSREEPQGLAEMIGRDGRRLLQHIYAAPSPTWLRELPAITILRQGWIQQVYAQQEQAHWRDAKELPPSGFFYFTAPSDQGRLNHKRRRAS